MGRKKKRYQSSSSEESDSDSSSSSDDSSSDSSSSESESSSSESESESSSSSESEVEDTYDEDPEKTKEDIKEMIRDNKLMKFQKAIVEDLGISSLPQMRDCTERQLKKAGMEYSERERLLKAFRQHLDERAEKLKSKKKKGGGSKSKKGKKKKSKGKSKSSKSKKSKSRSKKTDEDPLAKLDTGWSGKKQAWKDYKDHEARVAELVEFYEEIGRKRTNGEEHARKLLVSYPGGIGKLVIALDKKYHHIPYGWEDVLEEAYRKEELDGGSESD